MKPFAAFAFFVTIFFHSFGQNNQTGISLIPLPVSLKEGKGRFILKRTTNINLTTKDTDAKRVADLFCDNLSRATGYSIPVKNVQAATGTSGNITFSIVNDPSLRDEGYKLNITPTGVYITAYKPAGLFYGMQTLLQLFPKEIAGKTIANKKVWPRAKLFCE